MGMTVEPTLLQLIENFLNSMTEKHHETYDSVNEGCGAQIILISEAIVNCIRMDCSTLYKIAEEMSAFFSVICPTL